MCSAKLSYSDAITKAIRALNNRPLNPDDDEEQQREKPMVTNYYLEIYCR